MLFGEEEEDLRGKINKVYNKKKYKNYNNIELFSTIDASVIVSPPILEGLISDTVPGMTKTVNDTKKLGNAYLTTLQNITKDDIGNVNLSNEKSLDDELNALRNAGETYYAKIKSKKQKLVQQLNDVGEKITKFKVKESMVSMETPTEPPSTFKDILLHFQSVFSFILNFINNTLVYISIVLVQVIYGDKPILPWGNLKKPFTVANWPWKLDLNVSQSDNLALDPSAILYDVNNESVPDGNGGTIPAEQYNRNQKILYDANIVFNLFTQIILVALTWVFTNNAYYYLYNDPSTDIDPSSFPFRVILPNNTVGGINVKRGLGGIIPFTFVNTLVTSPYDMLFLMFYGIKWITQKIGLYEFRALTYIILFLIILWFSLTKFWSIYDDFMEEPFAFVFNPFFAIFIIYGIYQHFFTVSIVDDENKGIESNIKTNILHFISLFIIFSGLVALYPIIRIFFYFWSIYVFFGLQGFGNDTYDDIMKHENKKTCDSNKVSIVKIIREIIQSFFQYFFYFVIFILIISNFTYLNTIPTFNSSSSSGMKILLSIIFLFVFMFLVYSLLNKNTPRTSKIVVYGKSYVNESPPALGDIVNKIDMPKFDKPLKPVAGPKTPTETPTTTAETPTTTAETPTTTAETPTPTAETLTELELGPEKPISTEYLNILKSKVKALLLKLDDDTSYSNLIPDNKKLYLKIFVDMLKKIEEILDSPILTELLHTPFYITKLVKKIETNTSIPLNMKPYIAKTILFLKEIIHEKMDVRISNFINEVSNIQPPTTESITEYITNIKTVFTKEITEMNYKVARILKRVFPNEISNLINITQIYNTPGLNVLFVNAEPEMAVVSMLITEIYPEETKPGFINSFTSAAKVVRNTFR